MSLNHDLTFSQLWGHRQVIAPLRASVAASVQRGLTVQLYSQFRLVELLRELAQGALSVSASSCRGGGHGNDFGTENSFIPSAGLGPHCPTGRHKCCVSCSGPGEVEAWGRAAGALRLCRRLGGWSKTWGVPHKVSCPVRASPSPCTKYLA